MDKELKSKWIDALRSGKFKQCRGQYYDEETAGHCCLNVLHLVANKGMRDKTERAVGPHEQLQALVDMNDGRRSYEGRPQSFAQIADWVEANL